MKTLGAPSFGEPSLPLSVRFRSIVPQPPTRQTNVLFYAIRPCNGLDTIVSNGRKKTMFRVLLDTALKTVAYRWQMIQIVETLVHRQIRFIPIKEGIEFDG